MRPLPRLSLIAFLALMSAPLAVTAQGGGSSNAGGPSLERGRSLYGAYCTRCHGVNMVNIGATFDLRKFPPDQRERFERSVTQGLRAMPAWGGVMKPGDTDALWLYVTDGRRTE